jgi:hypothetical protein
VERVVGGEEEELGADEVEVDDFLCRFCINKDYLTLTEEKGRRRHAPVTVCSTWTRGLISRKTHSLVLEFTRNSNVPRPLYRISVAGESEALIKGRTLERGRREGAVCEENQWLVPNDGIRVQSSGSYHRKHHE